MSDRRKQGIPTYYDLPALNTPHWDWRVSAYIFAAGLGGGTQLLAALGELLPRREGQSISRKGRTSRCCRRGAPLLIWDLKTPRWYNMMDLPVSPLTLRQLPAHGVRVSAMTALGHGQPIADLAWDSLPGQWPAALFGADELYSPPSATSTRSGGRARLA